MAETAGRLEARERRARFSQKKTFRSVSPPLSSPSLRDKTKKGDPICSKPKPHVVPLGDGQNTLKWTGKAAAS